MICELCKEEKAKAFFREFGARGHYLCEICFKSIELVRADDDKQTKL